MILYNGKIYTSDGFFQAIFFQNKIIIDFGFDEEILKKYPLENKINLNGRLVIPGFIDSHMHLFNYSINKSQLDLRSAKSINQVIELGKKFLQLNSQKIIAFGYNDVNFEEKRLLNRFDLDQISNDIPIIATRICGHIVSVNTRALEIANISKGSRIPLGQIDIDQNGVPLGILREKAIELLKLDDSLTIAQIKTILLQGIADANACGLTSIGTNDLSENEQEATLILQAYQELENEGRLNIRINHQITFQETSVLSKLFSLPLHSSLIKMGPLKLFMDGSLGGKTALLKDSYLDTHEKGILCLDLLKFDELLLYCKQTKRQIIVHAIGNEAIDLCLNHYKKFQDDDNTLRWGIVHVQITDKDILEKFAKQKICAFVQPPFIISDMELVKKRISKTLVESSYLFGSLAKITATGFGSDSPVENFNPLIGIYANVTRANWDNTQEYLPSEKQTVFQALQGYTETNAFLTFEEKNKGKIKRGYFADLVVLHEDIFIIPKQDIKNVKVDLTIMNGEIIYERGKQNA
ncbi:MAG: amidohydrolase [Bacilli bacterium]